MTYKNLTIFLLPILSLYGCQKLESKKKHSLVAREPAVILLIPEGKFCACGISNLAKKLNAVYASEKKFLTVIQEAKTQGLSDAVQKDRDLLPGEIVFDPNSKLTATYNLDGSISLLFIDKDGGLKGMVPAGSSEKHLLKTAHQIMSSF